MTGIFPSLFLFRFPPPSALQQTGRLCRTLALLVCSALTACGFNTSQSWDERLHNRQEALARAVPMPAGQAIRTLDLSWTDARRQAGPREVPARLYLPAQASPSTPLPLVVFSHGLGGSREGYSYLGQYWASHGIASLHLQHVGSDRQLWVGNRLELVSRLHKAAQADEAVARARDVSFALDRILQDKTLPAQLDPARIAVAGHSYGANTSLLVAGAQAEYEGRPLSLRDPRIRAAIIISAPPFYGLNDFQPVLRPARVNALHVTATGDDITIPGFQSGLDDRLRVFEAYGAARKALVVFKGGSHSMFTDRLGTGGERLNPQVKEATREITLSFLRHEFGLSTAHPEATVWPAPWLARHAKILERLTPGT